MAMITLSWQYGCLGGVVAEEAAQQLGYELIGKQQINEMLRRDIQRFSQEVEVDDSLKNAEEEIEAGYFQRLQRQHSAYTNLLFSLFYEAASENRAIIKGYGAQTVLSHMPQALCVRLKGRLEARVDMIQKRLQLARDEAEKLVQKEDRERMELIQYIFKREISNIKWYDLVLDIEKVGLSTIIELIIRSVKTLEEKHPVSDEKKAQLKKMAFEYRTKAVILKSFPEIDGLGVRLDDYGVMTLSGKVDEEQKKERTEQIVGELPEVQNVVNTLTVDKTEKLPWKR